MRFIGTRRSSIAWCGNREGDRRFNSVQFERPGEFKVSFFAGFIGRSMSKSFRQDAFVCRSKRQINRQVNVARFFIFSHRGHYGRSPGNSSDKSNVVRKSRNGRLRDGSFTCRAENEEDEEERRNIISIAHIKIRACIRNEGRSCETIGLIRVLVDRRRLIEREILSIPRPALVDRVSL